MYPTGLENTVIPQLKIKIIEIPHEKFVSPQTEIQVFCD